jgi:cytochrome c553
VILRALLVAAALAAATGPAAAQDTAARRGAAVAADRGCANCHGAQGIATLPEVPSLAGMPAEFIELQMILFREGLRDVAAMNAVARGLSDAEVTDLAAFYAALPPGPPPDRGERDEAKAERGAALSARMHCGSCHLPDYRGRAQIPRLAGQREDYLRHAMTQYRDNRRVGTDTQMNGVMFGVTDAGIAALAHHLAHRP